MNRMVWYASKTSNNNIHYKCLRRLKRVESHPPFDKQRLHALPVGQSSPLVLVGFVSLNL
jgi:hypothetical protein